MSENHTPSTTHAVTIADSDVSFQAHSEETILDAALRLGLPVPYGCQTGHCGACRAHLASGEFVYEHEPAALTRRERDADLLLLCQAQARSDITLDVSLLARDGHLNARTYPARIEDMHWLAHDVVQLQLQLPKRKPFDWLPGQYIDILYLPPGGEVQRRSFSIANTPNPENMLELQLRLVPGGSFVQTLVNDLGPGTMLRIKGPLGGFYWRDAPDRPAVLIAGGTGFAPVRSIVANQITNGQTKPMHVYWGVRARRDLYDADLARSWARTQSNVSFTPVLSEPEADSDWAGATGFVHEHAAQDFPDASGIDVYMSGPPVLVNAVKQTFGANGLRPERTFYDAFEYAHVTWPSAAD